MNIKSLKIAVATVGDKGLEDKVSHAFGKTKTFTVITITGNRIENVKVLRNPASTYQQGAGPIAVQLLAKEGINIAIGGEIGPGVSTLLEQQKIKRIVVEPNTKVSETIKKLLEKEVNY